MDAPPPGVTEQAATEHYQVNGDDLPSLTRSLNDKAIREGNQRFRGYHRWNVTWRMSWRLANGECRVTRATVRLTTTIVLPEWKPPPGADESLRTGWARYLEGLTRHELGHRARTRDGAAGVRDALLAARAPRCDLLESAANAAAHRVLAATRAADEEYDRTTRHGATQGAVWPPPASRDDRR